MDPNLKSILYFRIQQLYVNVYKENNIEFMQFIRNLLNLCETTEEVYYSMPASLILKTKSIDDGYISKPFINKLDNFKKDNSLNFNILETLIIKNKLIS